MSTKIHLISEETLKKYTLVNNNVDGKYISVAIEGAQDIDLDTIIGSVLNNKLQDLVRTGEIETATDYKHLLDEYVVPYLAWQVMSNVQIAVNYKLTNSGTIQNDDERKSHLEYSNQNALMKQYQYYANSYASKLKNYLLKNVNKYPEYTQCDNYEYAMDSPLCDIYLGHIDNDRCNYIGK